MSKRYGRTQKRKHREKITQLEHARSMDADLAGELQQMIDKYKYLYTEIVRAIEGWCKNHTTIQPKEVVVDQIFHGKFNMALYPHMDLADFTDMNSVATIEIHQVMMHIIEIIGRKDIFSKTIHVLVRGPREQNYQYAISEKSFNDLRYAAGYKDYLHREVARALYEATTKGGH